MKLSAPYRVSNNPLETRPEAAWLAAILEVAADRCVWGSDWPHTPPHEAQTGGAVCTPYRELIYAHLIDDFSAEVRSSALFDQIMRKNPARLYAFEGD
jgi:predicted TIM-barrel fold metal-dependent hydrolase